MARDPFLHSPPFPARFTGGECASEGDEIEEGDLIIMSEDGASHVVCFDHGDCPEGSTCE